MGRSLIETIVLEGDCHGIDPYHRRFGAAFWWRWILGSPQGSLVGIARLEQIQPIRRQSTKAAYRTARRSNLGNHAGLTDLDSSRSNPQNFLNASNSA
jgi:hypothetical protein